MGSKIWTYKPDIPKNYDKLYAKFRYVSVRLEETEDGIYNLTLETDEGMWEERYSREGDANDFLRGMKAGMVLTAGNYQSFPDNLAQIKFLGKRKGDEPEHVEEHHLF